MKYSLLIAGITLMALNGCKKDDNNNNGIGNSTGGIVTTGQWRVSYFFDKDKEETSDYNGYVFEFKSGGGMTATRNGQTTSGNWSEGTDDGKPRFNIQLNTTDDKLSELNDDWVVDSKTDKELKLSDDNDTHTEQLHFTRQ